MGDSVRNCLKVKIYILYISIFSVSLFVSCEEKKVAYIAITSPFNKENTTELVENKLRKKKFNTDEWKAASVPSNTDSLNMV